MLRINDGSPFIMQDNLETTLQIAVLKKIKQKRSSPTLFRIPQIHTTYGKDRCKMSFPLQGKLREAVGQLQCINISKFLLHMHLTLRLTVFKESFQSRSPSNMKMEAAHFLKIVICSSLKAVIFQPRVVQIFPKKKKVTSKLQASDELKISKFHTEKNVRRHCKFKSLQRPGIWDLFTVVLNQFIFYNIEQTRNLTFPRSIVEDSSFLLCNPFSPCKYQHFEGL